MTRDESPTERFVVERLAASGGMGRVFRARDAQTGDVVALKVLDRPERGSLGGASDARDRALERFAREARLLAQLRHPGIVRFVAFGVTAAGEPYLAMEWLEGETLARRLSRGALDVHDALAVGRRVAQALGSAHLAGVVHRDVKPSNLFLVDGDCEKVKVIDFGIARLAPLPSDVTRPGGVLGTPGYMAPEQARALRDVGARADVYALGCVMFRCLTGRLPFEGDDPLAVLAKILLERSPRVKELLPSVPSALDDLVARMLAKDPAKRPADGAAVAAEIDALDRLAGPASVRNLSVRPPALTEGEQRFVSIVVIGAGTAARSDADAKTASVDSDAVPSRIGEAVTRLGAQLEWLADGSLVAVLSGYASATDQAAQAARCAIALRASLPREPMALATGRVEVAAGSPVGEVIDRAARLLHHARSSRTSAARLPVALDRVTAALLDARFDVAGDPETDEMLELRGERELTEVTRQLLGRPSPCVGRERDLATLLATFDECVDDSVARAVLVTAPAGVGKSRLRHELLRALRAKSEKAEIWFARGDPMSAGAPFGMLAQALRRGLGILEGEPARTRQKKLRARVARHVAREHQARVAEFVGELVGAPFTAESVQLRAARKDPQLMGDQMRRAWEDLVAAECVAHPIVLVLEDMHWGDVPTVRFVDAALAALDRSPFFLVALARPEVHDVFPKLWEGRNVQELRLAPLTRRASERLVRQILGDTVTAETVERLVERAGGNAFFLEELIRATAGGDVETFPETVLAMVQARLEGLDAESRRVLRGASVFGQTFWRGGAAALLGADTTGDTSDGSRRAGDPPTLRVDEALEQLIVREMIVRRATSKFRGEIELSFRHELVREGAYAMLTDRDRRVGHGLAARWLEEKGEASALVLAEHFERGGDTTRAAGLYQRAAAQALEGNDLVAALARAERGVACGAEGETLGALRLLQTETLRWRGEPRAARDRGLEAMELLPRHSDLWYDAAGQTMLMSSAIGDTKQLVVLADDLLARGADLEASREAASNAYFVCASRVAGHLVYNGHHDHADRLFARIDALLAISPPPEPRTLGAIAYARGTRALDQAAFVDCFEEYRAAHAAYLGAGDLRASSIALQSLAYAQMRVGLYAEAAGALRDAVAASERMGLRHAALGAAHNLGLALARLGQLDEARELEENAATVFEAEGNPRIAAGARAYLANAHLLAGDVAAAEREARKAIAIGTSAPSVRALAYATLADALLAAKDIAGAVAAAREAKRILDEIGGVDEGDTLLRLVYARALDASGDVAGARDAIVDARTRLLDRAAKITDPALRSSFVERVPENAATLALATRLAGASVT